MHFSHISLEFFDEKTHWKLFQDRNLNRLYVRVSVKIYWLTTNILGQKLIWKLNDNDLKMLYNL